MALTNKEVSYGLPLIASLINQLSNEYVLIETGKKSECEPDFLYQDILFFNALYHHLEQLQEDELKQ